MTEGNFVDYVKIFVSSGKGGKGSTHTERNLLKKGVQMVAMVAGGHVYLG
jgi:GTP-binding protein